MIIRKATTADIKKVTMSLRNRNIAYNTPAQAKTDIINGYMFVIESDDGRIIGSMCLVPEPHHGYSAVKRGCIYNRKNNGKGYARMLMEYIIEHSEGTLGCTPWAENKAVLHILATHGFEYRKTVCENYLVHVLERA